MAEVALGAADRVVIIASDGVWEFLTNQAVVELVAARFDNPVEACHAVVARAYELWIEREGRSDDRHHLHLPRRLTDARRALRCLQLSGSRTRCVPPLASAAAHCG